MIREFYPMLLENDAAYAAGMRKIVANTREFVEFLTNVLNVDLSSLRGGSRRRSRFTTPATRGRCT